MSQKTYIRKIENFICKNCGYEVIGNGYTNHCPQCLWSRHVDMYPGDRLNQCKGMMIPVGIEMKDNVTRIVHKCIKCGTTTKNKTADNDNRDLIIELSINPVI